MKKHFLVITALFSSCMVIAQQSLDSSFPFETEPLKKYSLYIPSSYDMNTPNKVMLAFHPYNTSKWNALSWRNELINFAENNGLLLVCPDGGKDGRVDDDIDYRFTTALLDSVKNWYNIDDKGIFAMGFSVGGKAMYEYGLENATVFSGFIPVGPAINGTSEVDDVLSNAICKPFYLVHGENDSPNTRYTPIKQALTDNKAEVNFILMAGIGHTFTFPNRESILKKAFQWIDTVTCKTNTGIVRNTNGHPPFRIYPSVLSSQESLYIGIRLNRAEVLTIEVFGMDGKVVYRERDSFRDSDHAISTQDLKSGSYIVKISSETSFYTGKFVLK